MSGWPTDQRVIARRVPRPAGQPAKLGEHPDWRYGAFTTNTTTGQIQWLDARHRTQAHIEDKMKEVKVCGGENLPSKDFDRNSAWLQLAALATSLNAWLRHIALDGNLARAEPKALRYRLLSAPARHIVHARTRILKIPPGLRLGQRPHHGLQPTPRPKPRLNHHPSSRRATPPRPEHGTRGPPEHPRADRHATPHPTKIIHSHIKPSRTHTAR
jgi:hypothetical protein